MAKKKIHRSTILARRQFCAGQAPIAMRKAELLANIHGNGDDGLGILVCHLFNAHTALRASRQHCTLNCHEVPHRRAGSVRRTFSACQSGDIHGWTGSGGPGNAFRQQTYFIKLAPQDLVSSRWIMVAKVGRSWGCWLQLCSMSRKRNS